MRLLLALAWLLTMPCCLAQQSGKVVYQDSITVLGDAEPVTQGQVSRAVVTIATPPAAELVSEPAALLRLDSSVDVQMRGAMGVQADVSMRGGTFEQTLVLLNGLRINDAQTSHFNFDVPVPLTGIAGMDVLHGSGSTLYGSDAISGAVNVRTLEPKSTSLLLRAGAGSYGMNQQAVQGTAAGVRGSLLLAGERDFSTGFMVDRDYRSESVAGEGRMFSGLGTSDLLAAASDRSYGANQFYGNYPSWERTKGWFLGGTQDLGARTAVSAAYRRHTDVFELFRDDPALYENNHVADSVQILVRRKDTFGDKVRLFSGVDNNLDQIASNVLGRHGRNRSAGYVQADLRGSRLFLSAALREEVVGGYGVVSSPGFSGSAMVWRRLKARASVGYGFRLPTFTDKYYSDPTTLPNAALKPESAWSTDGGFDWYATSRVTLSASGYTSRQTDAIDYVRASGQAKYQAQNLSKLQLTGAEISVRAELPHAETLHLAYTSVTGIQDVLGNLQSRYLYNFPSHQGSAEWIAPLGQIAARIRVGATQRYSSRAYATVDVSAARDEGVLRPYVRMTNLANTGYEEIAGVRMQGRAFEGGIEIELMKRHK